MAHPLRVIWSSSGPKYPFVFVVIARLNLASRPFRNRTLPYLLAALLVTLAGAGAVLGFANFRDLDRRTELAKAQTAELTTELGELNSKGEVVQQELTPDQRALLVGAHKLVANKSFGWSRLFADLESVMPPNVSASRIGVRNVFRDSSGTKAELEMTVLSRDYRSVLTMLDNMNTSGMFRAELRSQNLKEGERIAHTEFALNVIYSPGIGVAAPQQQAQGVRSGE